MFIFVLVKGRAPFTPNKAADFSLIRAVTKSLRNH